jgi:cytochrome c553
MPPPAWSSKPLNRRAKIQLAALALVVTSLPAGADGDIARGAMLTYTCSGCHGIENYKNAYPKYSVPKLGGQNEAYIATALAGYASGARWHPTMRGFAAGLSKKDRADVAAFFKLAGPKLSGASPVGEPPEAAGTCVACHGNTGVGTMDEYPILAGQHADYLAQALNDYRLGKRKSPIMQPFAQQLTQDDIEALAEFYSEQKGLETAEHD